MRFDGLIGFFNGRGGSPLIGQFLVSPPLSFREFAQPNPGLQPCLVLEERPAELRAG